jgi:hypothetical protein
VLTKVVLILLYIIYYDLVVQHTFCIQKLSSCTCLWGIYLQSKFAIITRYINYHCDKLNPGQYLLKIIYITMILQLKSLLLQYTLIIVCAAVSVQTVCVYPNDQSHLSNSDCVSLESLLKEQVWSPGTSMRFSVGIYSFSIKSTTKSILVRDSSNISLLGDAFGPTVIECDGRLGFTFINVTNLTIANIQFMQCGAPVNVHEALQIQINSITPGTKAAHFLVNTHKLLMTNVSTSYSPGYGLLCVNLHGESHIVKTNFSFNGIDSTSDHEHLEGGSIFLLYHEDGTTCICVLLRRLGYQYQVMCLTRLYIIDTAIQRPAAYW